jgi:hypothetical protein
MRRFCDIQIKEVGGWCQWRWINFRRRLRIFPFISISKYRCWRGILRQVTIEFGWLGWNGQLWFKRDDSSIKQYGPLKNSPYPESCTDEASR